MDKTIRALHIWHPRKMRFLKTVRDNGKIYESKRRANMAIANRDGEWGEG